MLGMLRRAREKREERERNCPCKQTCLCHQPEPGVSHGWGTLIVLSPILLLIIMAIFGPLPPPERRTIHVGNKVCDVVFVKTGETCEDRLLHHECRDVGFDQAICP